MTFGVPIRAILFDIDDTLVDWRSATKLAVQAISSEFVPDLSAEDWERFNLIFRVDSAGFYQAYLDGKLGFVEQRIARVQLAFAEVGGRLPDEAAEQWNSAYETEIHRRWAPYADVLPVLDALDTLGIPYGAVSNNVADYQRRKLDLAGLQRISVLVGTDTVGVPKPDPAIFHEGARQLGGSILHLLCMWETTC